MGQRCLQRQEASQLVLANIYIAGNGLFVLDFSGESLSELSLCSSHLSRESPWHQRLLFLPT